MSDFGFRVSRGRFEFTGPAVGFQGSSPHVGTTTARPKSDIRHPKSSLGRREFLSGVAAMLGPVALWGSDEQVIPFLDSKPFNPEKPNMPWEQLTSWISPAEHIF